VNRVCGHFSQDWQEAMDEQDFFRPVNPANLVNPEAQVSSYF
jgi:hypothetical protein